MPRGNSQMVDPATHNKIKAQADTIATMRLFLAALVHRYGVFDRLDLTLEEIAAVKEGELKIDERPDRLVLKISGVAPKLVMHS